MKMIVRISRSPANPPKRRVFISIASVFLLLICIVISCPAQGDRPQILHGVVLDPNHAAIVGARLGWEGIAQASVMTDAQGEFSIALPPGSHQLKVEADGFETIALAADQPGPIEIILQVSAATAIVTVTGADTFGYRAEAL